MSRRRDRRSARGGKIALAALAAAALAPAARAQTEAAPAASPAGNGERPEVVLELGAKQASETFGCRVPVTVRSPDAQLRQLSLVAKAQVDGTATVSSGLDTGIRPLIRERTAAGYEYEPVPLQFEWGDETCRRMDGVEIVFARCEFDGRPVTDCLPQVRFADAGADRPRYSPVDSGSSGRDRSR